MSVIVCLRVLGESTVTNPADPKLTHKRKHGVLYRALKLRGMNAADLAQRLRLSKRTIHNLSCGNHTSPKTRALIEAELRMHVWNTPPQKPSPIQLTEEKPTT